MFSFVKEYYFAISFLINNWSFIPILLGLVTAISSFIYKNEKDKNKLARATLILAILFVATQIIEFRIKTKKEIGDSKKREEQYISIIKRQDSTLRSANLLLQDSKEIIFRSDSIQKSQQLIYSQVDRVINPITSLDIESYEEISFDAVNAPRFVSQLYDIKNKIQKNEFYPSYITGTGSFDSDTLIGLTMWGIDTAYFPTSKGGRVVRYLPSLFYETEVDFSFVPFPIKTFTDFNNSIPRMSFKKRLFKDRRVRDYTLHVNFRKRMFSLQRKFVGIECSPERGAKNVILGFNDLKNCFLLMNVSQTGMYPISLKITAHEGLRQSYILRFDKSEVKQIQKISPSNSNGEKATSYLQNYILHKLRVSEIQ